MLGVAAAGLVDREPEGRDDEAGLLVRPRVGALFANTTRAFADLSFGAKRDGVDAGLPGAAFVPGLVAFAGGLPIKTAAGDVIGAIGVSGASEDEDEHCAQAGLDAISTSLD